jgi:hypothetical protein
LLILWLMLSPAAFFDVSRAAEIRGIGNKCLDVSGGGSADGTPIIFWSCHGGDNQKWAVVPSGLIRSINGKCLDVSGGVSANGTPIILWSCHGGENQNWIVQ